MIRLSAEMSALLEQLGSDQGQHADTPQNQADSAPTAEPEDNRAILLYTALGALVVCLCGAAVAILLGAGYFGISAAAFCGGLAAVALAWLVSRLSRTETTLALVLAGMMVSSLFSAGTSFIKLIADTQQQLPAITYWLMGSLSSIKPRDVAFLAIPTAIGLVPLLLLRWRINLLTLSEAEARSMGVDTRRLRLLVIFCATLMTAASVSISVVFPPPLWPMMTFFAISPPSYQKELVRTACGEKRLL